MATQQINFDQISGIGSMASQDSGSVNITGGTITGVSGIGGTTAPSQSFLETTGSDGSEFSIDRSIFSQRDGTTIFSVGRETSVQQDTYLYMADSTGVGVNFLMGCAIGSPNYTFIGSTSNHDLHLRQNNIDRAILTPNVFQLSGIEMDFNFNKGINILPPTASGDVVNKGYIDDLGIISSSLQFIVSKEATIWADEGTTITGSARSFDAQVGQCYTIQSYQNPPADGDISEWGFVLKNGTYDLSILGNKNLDRGMVDWYIDSNLVISGQDWYNGTLLFNEVQSASVSITTPGHHILRSVVNGKNGSSTNFYFSFTKAWFKPTISTFLPIDISGLKFWLSGDSDVYSDAGITPAINNDPVFQWNDLSGNGNHVIQTVVGLQPLFKTNTLSGKPVVYFDGVDDYIGMTSPFAPPIGQPNTVFIVFKMITPGYLFDGIVSFTLTRQFVAGNGTFVGLSADGGATYLTIPSPILSTPIIAEFSVDGASSTARKNGVSVGAANPGSFPMTSLVLGSDGAFGTNCECHIAEIIVYDALLSAPEIVSVESYLNTKYLIY